MTQAKHTPGPWKVSQHDMGTFIRCQGDYIIAGPVQDRPDGEDNAALIAAAPELLEALIRLDIYVRSFTLDATGWKKVDAARAAIAKAGGAA